DVCSSDLAVGSMALEMDDLAEPYFPLRRRWKQSERAEPREGRCDGQIRQTEELRRLLVPVEHRARFFRAHDDARDQWRPGAEAETDKPAASEPLELVSVAIELADAFHALRKHPDEALLLQEALGIFLARADSTYP